jgi:hypothetical protein
LLPLQLQKKVRVGLTDIRRPRAVVLKKVIQNMHLITPVEILTNYVQRRSIPVLRRQSSNPAFDIRGHRFKKRFPFKEWKIFLRRRIFLFQKRFIAHDFITSKFIAADLVAPHAHLWLPFGQQRGKRRKYNSGYGNDS